jgi:hypothetical protein
VGDFVEELSQEEIELLMSGMLSEEKSKEILESKNEQQLKPEENLEPKKTLEDIKSVEEKPLTEVTVEDTPDNNIQTQSDITKSKKKTEKNEIFKNITQRIIALRPIEI